MKIERILLVIMIHHLFVVIVNQKSCNFNDIGPALRVVRGCIPINWKAGCFRIRYKIFTLGSC